MAYTYALVALRTRLPGGGQELLTYKLPPLLQSIDEGALVWVPLGRRRVQGVVVALQSEPPAGVSYLRDIEGLGDAEAVVPWPQLRLARWLATEYQTPLSDALDLVLPPGSGQELETTWR